MIRAHLVRTETGDEGTFGRFTLPGGLSWHSGEMPDRKNAPSISCIPTGLYRVIWTYSPAFKRMMYLVDRVPGRSGIRIHVANLMGDKSKGFKSEMEGCIALGRSVGQLWGQRALLESKPAIAEFQDYMAGETFELEITEAYEAKGA